MDSLPGEDPTLPLQLDGSVNISRLQDVSGDDIHIRLGGGGALPDMAEETVSPSRARTMKDFENQITELRKENFNLKLRIYFLEERMQQKFDGPSEEIYRINIELKVELESLKRDLQEREQLLIKASKAVESLAQGGDAEIQRLKEESRKQVQQVEDNLTSRIHLLEEDLKTAQEELEKALAVTEQERVTRLAAEGQLSLLTSRSPKDLEVVTALEEKDRCIEQLTLSLQEKAALIQRLEEPQAPSGSPEGSLSAESLSADPSALLPGEKAKELEALRTALQNEKSDFEKRMQELQDNLHERGEELSVEKRNALKRDKTIQGLTLALKTKENENEELSSEINKLNELLAKAREATHTAQMQKFKGAEDYQALLVEKESLLADLRSENLNKDTENRKLQRKIRRADQELNDLRLEREKLAKELEEAQLQKSRSDKAINDLRNQLEKSHDEMAEKEKALELHYCVLLSENNQKLQSQELVITRLTDGAAQKDQLLQKLDGAIQEKDAELQEWLSKCQGLLREKEALQKQNEDLVKEKLASPSQQPVIKMIRELEKTKESEYAELMEALRRERDTFSTLIKSLKETDGINNLQEELNNVFILRRQLEEDVLANWNLQKLLEEQIKGSRREEETISSWGDQTSYLSICLGEKDHLHMQIDHLSLEELKKKVVELLSVVKELHSANQDLRQKHLELSRLNLLANEQLQTFGQSEFLERAEESRTLTESFLEETSALIGQSSESSSEQAIPSDSLDTQTQDLSKPTFENELAVGERFGASEAAQSCEARGRSSLASLFHENGVAVLESRQEEMTIANQLLDHLNTTKRDSSSADLENRGEEDLKRLIIQLRAELKRLTEGNAVPGQQGESQTAWAEAQTALDPDPVLQRQAEVELSKVELKETSTQTMTVEGNVLRLTHEGKIGSSEDKAKNARLSGDWECQREGACSKNQQQEIVLRTSKTNKSDSGYSFKKSRLPVLRKLRSVESIPLSNEVQKPDMHLQHHSFTLDKDLKGRCASQLLSDELQPSKAESGRSEEDAALTGESLIEMDCTEADISLASGETKDEMCQDQSSGPETSSNEHESSFPAVKGLNQELDFLDKQDAVSTTTYSGSKSLLSLKLSSGSTDLFDECEIMDDVEELRRRIKELKSELAKYTTSPSQTAQPLPPGNLFGTVQNDGKLPTNGHLLPVLDTTGHERQAFDDGHQQVDDPIHMENLTPCVLEKEDEGAVEKLKELLLENEAELEKEQIANIHLLDEVYRLQSKLQGASPSSADSPAQERSCLRQRIRESHSVCVTYRQHLSNLIKAFEELLQASTVDFYIAEGFREQLSQSVQLFERLEKQCLYGESLDDEMAHICGLVRSLSDSEMSDKSCHLEPPEQKQGGAEEGEREKLAVVPAKLPPELLMEHLQEIRMLRHQLEESIKTNDQLRKQLEQQVVDSAQDPGSANVCIRGSEQHNSLTSEIHFLRKQNQVLNVMLAKGSREKQKENEKLRESLSKKHFAVEHLHKEYERLEKENAKLQLQVEKREEENGRLTHEVYSVRNEVNRLQIELNSKQHQLSENDKVLHSLRLELKVYEKLDEAIASQKDRSCNRSDECWKDQNHPLDLHELLTEIQNLRIQLERSIKANKALHEKLEEQLLRGGKREKASSGSTMNINYLLKQELQHFTGMNAEFKFPGADSNILELQQKYGCCTLTLPTELALDNSDGSSRCSSAASKSRGPCGIPGHYVWADKNGRHILGSVEDYNSLKKQISEGQKRLSDLELPLKEMEHPEPGAKVNSLSAAAGAIQQNLDEAARLLKLLWRVSLPMKVVHSAAYSLQDEGLKAELHKLRRKLAEQEKKLHSTVKRLHSTNQLKENMEKVIIDQLALTHDVLKKARGNLEIQPAEHKTPAFTLSKKRVL
ncbi:CDK5 regulatory subunit-associated protein 2 isoform X3 [Hemicordylus capensis]|uniref:CDK5 regulatory subunit-associated protein 2 isoform X3 n=1 Tax=Hemicordylus capensis TaxID=884348 RepID=UPI00230205F7|nr:CDK5 regulatory subunit-associated protein 2 isoform X3 [Hemicordylus capensis]